MTKDIKLFATDMDGTFLHSDRTFNEERFVQLLDYFEAHDLVFCASSGRQLLALEEVFDKYKNRIAFVAENGGVVAYKNQRITEHKFTKAQIKELIDLLLEMDFSPGYNFLISGLKGSYSFPAVSKEYTDLAKLYYANCQIVNSLDEIDDEFLKITTNFPEPHTADCEAYLNERLDFVRATTTGFASIDIVPAGVSKASGLQDLLEHFGWNKDNLISFGDHLNDLEMLKFAGTSVAVENAVDEIKAVSSYVIGLNNDDAVLNEMERVSGMK